MSEQWTDVGGEDMLTEEEPVAVRVADREIALYLAQGEVYATDNLCTHGNARLCEGFQEGHEIECPLHQGRFDIRDGRALCAPLTRDIRTYPSRVEGGRVLVRVAGAD